MSRWYDRPTHPVKAATDPWRREIDRTVAEEGPDDRERLVEPADPVISNEKPYAVYSVSFQPARAPG